MMLISHVKPNPFVQPAIPVEREHSHFTNFLDNHISRWWQLWNFSLWSSFYVV